MKWIQVAALIAATIFADASVAQAADNLTGSEYNWTGLYVGVNAGYGSSTESSIFAPGYGHNGVSTNPTTLRGAIGGGQIGYNWQTGNVVLGLELDLQASWQKAEIAAVGLNTAGNISGTDKFAYFGTARGRVGFAIDRWMPYITGGWGPGAFTSDVAPFVGSACPCHSLQSHLLSAVGGGVEVALIGNWSAKVEYLSLNSGTMYSHYASELGTHTSSGRIKGRFVRLGLNYRL